MLSDAEVADLQDIIDVLVVFHEATVKLSGENYATISSIRSIIRAIKLSLSNEPTYSVFKTLLSEALN